MNLIKFKRNQNEKKEENKLGLIERITNNIFLTIVAFIILSLIILYAAKKFYHGGTKSEEISASDILKSAKALLFYFSFIISVALTYFTMIYPYKRKKLIERIKLEEDNIELNKKISDVVVELEEDINNKIKNIEKDISEVNNKIENILKSSIEIKPNENFINSIKILDENLKELEEVNQRLSENLTELILNENISEYIKLKFEDISTEYLKMLKDSYLKLETFLIFIKKIKEERSVKNLSEEELIEKLEKTLELIKDLINKLQDNK